MEFSAKFNLIACNCNISVVAIAAIMMAGGIYNLQASFAAKGFYSMAAIMLVYSTASITKSIRDKEEADRIYNKLEDARTERLLSEVSVAEAK